MRHRQASSNYSLTLSPFLKSRLSLFGEMMAVILVVWIGYSPSLWNGFVYDDEKYVVQNPLVTGDLPLRRIFTETYPPQATAQGLYRPLTTLSYCLDASIWGVAKPNRWNGFHFTNILLHSINACLLLLILRQLGMERGPRLAAALLFGIHPALSEAVAWVVGRAELLGLNWGLLGLYLFLRHPAGWGLAMAFVCWILAMLCKENWVMWPALVALTTGCMPKTPKFEKPKIFHLGICVAAIAAIFWWFRHLILGSWIPPVSAFGSIDPLSRTAMALKTLWMYVGLWFWPFPLSVHHDLRPIPLSQGGFYLAAWLAMNWLIWKARTPFPWLALAFGWYILAMFPTSNLIIPIGALSGERFMYAGVLFFAPAMARGMEWGFATRRISPFWKTTTIILAAIIIALPLTMRLHGRLRDWQSNLTLWQSAARNYPECYGIKSHLASALFFEGRFAEARDVAEEALGQSARSPQPFQKHFEPRLMEVKQKAEVILRQQSPAGNPSPRKENKP
ncbi:MAG: hypothetical protein PHV34_13520 [Verrucomicrobiae bacterium]|nr:hypothetical protein [Verrucomicrobiae bacterium]